MQADPSSSETASGKKATTVSNNIQATYVSAGKPDDRWLSLFGRMQKKRETSQYSFSPAPLPDEIDSVIDLTEQFIDQMEKIVSDG